jgi:lipase maturation factor 1
LSFIASARSLARPLRPRSHHITRSVWLRGLGLVYLAAFGSLAVQLDGLIGSRGILPASEYLATASRSLGHGAGAYWRLPTLFWFNSSDQALHAVCWAGIALSLLLSAGVTPGICTVLLWAFYLSLTIVGQVFLGYQWDSLLLETGLLAILLAPWSLTLGRARDEPWVITIWLIRWLLFRLVFLSGVVKLSSGDPAWSAWRALEFHYQTQPLPAWTSWYLHRMPSWFHRLSVGFMFYAELVAPFFIFAPRPIRLLGFVCLVVLQVLIAGTGNYGFFNLLTIVLCLSLLDDRDWNSVRVFVARSLAHWQRWKRDSNREQQQQASTELHSWSKLRRILVGFSGCIILVTTLSQFMAVVWPSVLILSEIEVVERWLSPFRSTNHYGLFAVMTTNRPEIIVEGSDDGTTWKPYRFRWKPQDPDRPPRFTTPHLPRLDWQMWFAALSGDCRAQPWFLRFEQRLLAGSPEVLALLEHNPFPDHPPKLIRSLLYLYEFTSRGSRDWWVRHEAGVFCPPNR